MLSVVLALVLVFSSLSAGMMAFAAEEKTGVVDLPDGVTEEAATQVLSALDEVVKSEAVASLLSPGAESLNDAVNKLISDNLFTDAIVNEIAKAVYPMIQDTINNIENVPDAIKDYIFKIMKDTIGVYVKPADVATQIDDKYSDAQAAIAAAGDNWANVNWDNVKWGVTDRASFIDALGNALNGLNSVLRAALSGDTLEGQVKIGIPGLEVPLVTVKITGCNAYADIVLPLLQHIGADALTVEEYKAGDSTVEMLGNILNPLLDRVDSMTSGSPLTDIVDLLPTIGYVITNQLHVTAIQKLVVSIGISDAMDWVTWYTTQVNVGDLVLDAMPQIKDAAGINDLLESAITSQVPGFVWSDIDFELLSTLGKYTAVDNANGGKSFEIDAYRADVLVTVLRYALDTARANKTLLVDMIGDETVAGLLDTVFAMDNDEIISFLFSLFSPNYDLVNYEYNTPAIEKYKVDYGTQFTKEQIAQLVPTLDTLVGTLLPGGLQSLISSNLYTNNIVNTLVKEAYSAIEGAGAEVSQVLGLLGVDVTPKGLASLLTEKEFATAKAAFEKADSWADVDFSKVSYGFTDGDRDGFTNALVAVLRPVSSLLDFILTDENLVLFDAVTLKGGNGYNTAIIPLLEALGCTDIKTYDEYKKSVAADHDNLILDILNPILDLVEGIAATPIDGLTKILPNIAYFVDSNNVSVFVANLIAPVNSLLAQAGFDITKELDVLNDIDLDELLNGLLAQVLPENINIVLSNIDLHKVAALGTLTDFTSKRVDADGKFVASKKIVADQADVLVTVLRYILGLLQIEENYNTVNDLLAGLLPENMTGIVTSILDMAKADPDSAIALIVGILVGEDGGDSGDGSDDTTTPDDGYVDGGAGDVPTGDVAIAGFVATAVAAGAVLLIARKKKHA